jgi:hypothetical protein
MGDVTAYNVDSNFNGVIFILFRNTRFYSLIDAQQLNSTLKEEKS